MKTTLLFTLLLLPLLNFAQAPTDTVDIPDGHFKWFLLYAEDSNNNTVDANNDGEIQYSEAEAVTHLYLDPSTMSGNNTDKSNGQSNPLEYGPIDDLTGIEAFTNLTYLNVKYNNLTSLDLSNNLMLDTLWADYNQLTVLDLGNNSNLRFLSCSENNILNLDVTQQTGLAEIYYDYNQIDSLDLSHAPNLFYLHGEDNQLNYLDIRHRNMNIIGCYTYSNPDLTCIYVDDEVYAENAPYWGKDSTSHYVETEAECATFGIEEYAFQDISIYPNPVKDHIHIDNLQNKSKLSLYTLQGKKILSRKESEYPATLDVSNLTSGIYFLKIKVLNTSKDFKIIKL